MLDADAHVLEPRAAWNTSPREYRPRILGLNAATLYSL
jgi:hypothetical protein